jgi:ribose transport system ATP-binding protein
MTSLSTVDVDTVLETIGLSKVYGGTRALDGVDFDLRRGEVHAVIGENGAGKSTLINCLTGAVVPDSGTIIVNGVQSHGLTPLSSQEFGIAVVRQELCLFPTLTVAENILGRKATGGSVISWRRMWDESRELIERMGLDIDPKLRLDQLPIGQQQMIEIGKALFSGSSMIFLDEPTSSLGTMESELLFRFVHEMADQGVSFVLITHFLDDATAHSDRVTVFRDGRKVETVTASEVVKGQLVDLMIGDSSQVLQSTYASAGVTLPAPSTSEIVLDISGVSSPPQVVDMSLQIRAGEVVGIYGDLSSGIGELAELIFGDRPKPSRGSMTVAGRRVKGGSTTKARAAGIGFIPADRRQALALELPITWNATLAQMTRMMGFLIRPKIERAHVEKWTDLLRIRGASPEKAAGALSGGNQQKVLFARWLEYPPRVLVLVEPTRGMDVGAKSDVLRIVEQVAQGGTAVLVASSEPETVLAFAQRVLVAKRGRIVAEFSGGEVTKRDLLERGH